MRKGGYREFLPDGFDGDAKAYMRKHYEITARSVSRNPDRVDIYVKWKG
jgi:hypothetical protein